VHCGHDGCRKHQRGYDVCAHDPEDIPNRGRRKTRRWVRLGGTPSACLLSGSLLRHRDQPAQLQIDCLTGPNKPGLLTPAAIAQRLGDAARFVNATAALFADWAEEFAEAPNTVMEKTTGLGDPNNKFWHGYWALEEGEALVIEVMPPECEVWNFQLNNYWEESLDYRYFPVHINKHTASYEDDGRLVIIVSPTDPGWGNWIDTVGHRHGTLGLRWTRAIDPPKPDLRVVPFEEIARK